MILNNLNDNSIDKTQTLKFPRKINEVPVLILVDSGATHNSMSTKLILKMGLAIEETFELTIRLGDGFQTNTRGNCREVEMEIGDFKILVEAYLFKMSEIDVVLGVKWLKTLGDVIMNWTKQTMSFWSGKNWVTDDRSSFVILRMFFSQFQ